MERVCAHAFCGMIATHHCPVCNKYTCAGHAVRYRGQSVCVDCVYRYQWLRKNSTPIGSTSRRLSRWIRDIMRF